MGFYCYLVCAATVELIEGGGGPSQRTRLGKKGTTFAFSAHASAVATVVYLFIYLFIQEAGKGNSESAL